MTTFALNNLWNYLQGLSLSQDDREWLAGKLVMPGGKVPGAADEMSTRMVDDRRESSDARLDAALARFHKDWGGDKSPVEIANGLRQGAEMVSDVETW